MRKPSKMPKITKLGSSGARILGSLTQEPVTYSCGFNKPYTDYQNLQEEKYIGALRQHTLVA